MATWAEVVILDAMLSTVPTATQNALIADVIVRLGASPGAWGSASRYELASKLLLAHLGTMYLRGGTSGTGAVTSETVGPFSRSYATAASSSSADPLDATTHGAEYKRLKMGFLLGRVGFNTGVT